jgi:hypothetical protein
LHVILCAKRQLSEREIRQLRRRVYVRWARAIVGDRQRVGHRGESWEPARRAPSYRHGVDLDQARSVEDVARYASEVAGEVEAEKPAAPARAVMVREKTRLGLELTRSDLKKGNSKSRTPWEILRAVHETPACDDDGVASETRDGDVQLWREWERETKGKQAMRWSTGLKAVLGVYDLSDEEIVEAEVGGQLVHSFSTLEWWAVCGTKGASSRVLERAEDGGSAAVAEYLSAIVGPWQEKRERERAFEHRHPGLYRHSARDRIRRVA